MLALISFIAVIVGAINWFCIGLLQFDFVAGLFGSQSSIFSRIIYIVVGIGALVLLFNLIENKGKIKFNFKKKQNLENRETKKEAPTYYIKPKYSSAVEAGNDMDKSKLEKTEEYKTNIETGNEGCNNGYCKIENDNEKDYQN